MSPAELPATKAHHIIEHWKLSSQCFAQSHRVTQNQSLHLNAIFLGHSDGSVQQTMLSVVLHWSGHEQHRKLAYTSALGWNHFDSKDLKSLTFSDIFAFTAFLEQIIKQRKGTGKK